MFDLNYKTDAMAIKRYNLTIQLTENDAKKLFVLLYIWMILRDLQIFRYPIETLYRLFQYIGQYIFNVVFT